MTSAFYKRVTSIATAMAFALGLGLPAVTAQTSNQQDEHVPPIGGALRGVCGTELFNDGKEAEALAATARTNPALYQRIMDREKHPDRYSPKRVADDIFNVFLVRNRKTGAYDEITAALVYLGKRARIWVDTTDRKRIKTATVAALAKGLDSVTVAASRNPAKSIIENDEEVFGKAPANNFDPDSPEVTDFLLTDIKDQLTGAFVAGFFSPWDQTTNPGSNKMNLLYIDSREGLGTQNSSAIYEVLNTMAHEFQHLIHYNTNNASNVVFNEGCSEVASILNGYQNRQNTGYLLNTNVPMFKWNYDDGTLILRDYERAMTFVHYMHEQCGEQFITALTHTKTDNMDRVADALRQIGDSRKWEDLFCSWVAANYAGNFTQPYGYRDRLSTATPTSHGTFNAPFEPTGSIIVQQHAAAYLVYNNPGAVKVKFNASQPMKVMAMLYSSVGGSTKLVEIWQLDNNMEYTIGTYAKYNKIVFGVANLAFNAQTVKWDISSVTLGADEENSVSGGLSISAVTPNPTNGPAAIRFTVPVSGTVSAALYDMRGALVRTIAEGESFTAGEHELNVATDGLAAGTYIVRLVQGPRMANRSLVVLR